MRSDGRATSCTWQLGRTVPLFCAARGVLATDRSDGWQRIAWQHAVDGLRDAVRIVGWRSGAVLGLRDSGSVDCAMLGADARACAPGANPFAGVEVPVRQLEANVMNACVVSYDDHVLCAGAREWTPGCPDGQSCLQRAYEVPGLRALSVAIGGERTCARKLDGTVVCWGAYGPRQQVSPAMLEPELIAGLPRGDLLAGGGGHACGVAWDGRVYCWGFRSARAKAASLSQNETVRHAPERIEDLPPVCELSGGLFHMCGVTADGSVYCWGGNHFGQLGDGTNEDRPNRAVRTLTPGSVSD